MSNIAICAAKRTPIGGFNGELAGRTAPELGAHAIAAACAESTLAPEHIDEALMGIVLSAGVGQAPARQASLGAGLPKSDRACRRAFRATRKSRLANPESWSPVAWRA